MSEQSRRCYEFGPFSADPLKRLLFRNGEPVPLPPKVFETLLVLVENRHRVLTKDELLSRVWSDTIVEEGGLTKNISLLRKVLGEKPSTHRYIVTVPSRGYRFVADVREESPNGEQLGAGVTTGPAPGCGSSRAVAVPRWVALGALTALVVALVAYLQHPDGAIGRRSAGTANGQAYQEYQLGRYYVWKSNEQDLKRAIDHFERATRLDPGYAAAYAGLSHAWWARGPYGAMRQEDVAAPSRAAARKALALDDRLAEAHVALGRDMQMYEWDWPAAEQGFRQALAIDPDNVDAHYFYGFLLMGLGRFAESISHFERAAQVDPLSSAIQSGFGRALYRAYRFDEAITHLNRAIDLEPRNDSAYERLAAVYEEMGRYAEALATHEKASDLTGRGRNNLVTARIYARMGMRNEAREILDALRGRPAGVPPLEAAAVYAVLGEGDEAFELLFKHVEQRKLAAGYFNVGPQFESLQSDPRWPALLRHANLPSGLARWTRPLLLERPH